MTEESNNYFPTCSVCGAQLPKGAEQCWRCRTELSRPAAAPFEMGESVANEPTRIAELAERREILLQQLSFLKRQHRSFKERSAGDEQRFNWTRRILTAIVVVLAASALLLFNTPAAVIVRWPEALVLALLICATIFLYYMLGVRRQALAAEDRRRQQRIIEMESEIQWINREVGEGSETYFSETR